MKIAVSSDNQTDITGHAGHCLQFWIYEVDVDNGESKQLLQLSKDQSFHATAATEPHPLDGIQALISHSMGSGLARRLASKGIQPIVTSETDPDSAVAAYLVGSLVMEMPEEHGHSHTHEADHVHTGACCCNG